MTKCRVITKSRLFDFSILTAADERIIWDRNFLKVTQYGFQEGWSLKFIACGINRTQNISPLTTVIWKERVILLWSSIQWQRILGKLLHTTIVLTYVADSGVTNIRMWFNAYRNKNVLYYLWLYFTRFSRSKPRRTIGIRTWVHKIINALIFHSHWLSTPFWTVCSKTVVHKDIILNTMKQGWIAVV